MPPRREHDDFRKQDRPRGTADDRARAGEASAHRPVAQRRADALDGGLERGRPRSGLAHQADADGKARDRRGESAPWERLWPIEELRLHERGGLIPEASDEELRALLADLAERGFTTPLDVTAEGVVLDGRARLRAARDLGLDRVPVRTVAPEDEPEYILRAALLRRHLSESRRAALALELAAYQQASEEARKRRLANLHRGREAEVATLPPRGEKTRELAASLAGVSPRTVQDAATVREGDPALFAAVKAGTLPAHRAAERVRRARRDASLPPPPPLPEGPFQLLYADPPWQLGHPDGEYAPERHYPTMPLQEIEALRPPAAEDALLYLWAVNSHLREALQVMETWGFEYRTNHVWEKPSIGLGVWTRNRHELLLVGRRGRFPPPEPEVRPGSVIQAPRGRHSEKPEAFYQALERAYPQASKLELFARTARRGWTAWGNEAPT